MGLYEGLINNYSTNALWIRAFRESGRGAEHRVGYHKLISNKREWNNSFIKYQTLEIEYLEFYFLPTRVFGHFEGKFSVIKLSVPYFNNYRI